MNPLVTEARALCERATKGPWEVGDGTTVAFRCGNDSVFAPNGMMIVRRDLCRDERDAEKRANIRLCARSRTLLPEMAAEIERLQTENDEWKHINDASGFEYEKLREQNKRLQAELDALKALAEEDIRKANFEGVSKCSCCAYLAKCDPAFDCEEDEPQAPNQCEWEWRGMCSENSAATLAAMKEDAHE